jgi:hypothetical protein
MRGLATRLSDGSILIVGDGGQRRPQYREAAGAAAGALAGAL